MFLVVLPSWGSIRWKTNNLWLSIGLDFNDKFKALVISSANIQFTVSSVSSPNGLDVFAVTNNPSTASNSDVWTDVFDGNQYVDDSTTGDSTGSKTLDLGATAKSDIASLRLIL